MPSTTAYEQGDVVTVRFRFREGGRPKPRPAVVVSVPAYHESRIDAVLIAISGRTDHSFFGDCTIQDWRQAGLLKESKTKGVFRTIPRSKLGARLGSLSANDQQRLQESIRRILGLDD